MDPFIHIIIQYYNDKNPERQKELDSCILNNLSNPYVDTVHNLVEENTVTPEFISTHPKYKEKVIKNWITYKDAFDYANEHLVDKIVCLCNLDIYLDTNTDWSTVHDTLKNNIVLSLSRHDLDNNGNILKNVYVQTFYFCQTQDAWIFKPKICVKNCNFELGKIGCDNAIAHRLAVSGYTPVNMLNTFKIIHNDIIRGKTSKNYVNFADSNYLQNNPIRDGVYLVPEFEALDEYYDGLINSLPKIEKYKIRNNLPKMEKYNIACNIYTKLINMFPNSYNDI